MSLSLAEAQLEMARFLRDPQGRGAPAGIEERRLQVYRDLVYRNIEGFISSAFPVLRSLYEDGAWEARVRDFIEHHRCSTPLFLKISEEYLEYLVGLPEGELRPFEAELAHYEWLELAVDVAEGEPGEACAQSDPALVCAALAPTARLASYHFPVHRIGPEFQPMDAGEPTHLLVYRTRKSEVRFMELNAATARLITEMGSASLSVAKVLQELASEWGMDPEVLADFGWDQVCELNRAGALKMAPAREP